MTKDSRQRSVLAYALWWITGIVFLFVGRDDPQVRFHAAQSVVLFGELSIVELFLNVVGNALRGNPLAVLILVVSWVVGLFWVAAWLYCLYQAWSGAGRRFEVPLVGEYVTPYAERLADAVA